MYVKVQICTEGSLAKFKERLTSPEKDVQERAAELFLVLSANPDLLKKIKQSGIQQQVFFFFFFAFF